MLKIKTLVKICGITSLDQAIKIAELGPDAIGIISVKESARYVLPDKKREIFKALKDLYPHIERVSVVKNISINAIIQYLLEEQNETIIQLHGDENVEYCQKLKQMIPDICIWKAFRIKNEEDLNKIKPYENFIDAILLDSWSKEAYGGTGKRIESKYLKKLAFNKPWWLAGGISKSWLDEIFKI